VSNPEQKLKPGMTANLTVTIDERNNVLKVPNSALRFTPTDANGQRISGGGNGSGQGRRQNANAQQPATSASPNASPTGNSQQGGERQFAPASAPVLEGQTRAVWVLGADGQPQSRRIKIGLTDGAATEVVEGNLQEGEMVIIGQTVTSASKPSSSPAPGFGGAPRTPGGAGGGGGRRN
jgi:HlyD family secretion protein